MAKYLNSAGVTYLWQKIKALLSKPFKVAGSDGSYTSIGGGSVATGNADGDQTIIDNDGVTISGGALTIYEDTSKGGASTVIDYDEAVRLKGLKNYTLPAASGTTLGGVKSGGDVTIASGTITVNDDSHNHVISNVDGLQAALDAKAPLASPTLTGTPKAPTAASGTNTTQIATTAFVQAAVESKMAAADAMRYKGTLGTGGTITALPASHKVGDAYKVITAGTYAGQKCEVGDMVICVTAGSTANNAHWTVVQANVDGAVTGPASAVSGRVAVFDGTTGKVIKDGGKALSDITLDEISVKLTQSSRGIKDGQFYMNVGIDLSAWLGNNEEVFVENAGDVELLFSNATASGPGMMSAAQYTKLSGIATGATADSALSNSEIDAAIAAAG